MKCANFKCPIKDSCHRFVAPAEGEEHQYKVFKYTIGFRGDVYCLNFQIKSYATDREVHSGSGPQ